MFQIRSAILEDCPGIAKTQVDSYRTAYVGLLPAAYLEHFTYPEQEQDWVEILSSNMQAILLVALSEEKQVAGYILASAKPDIFPGYDSEIIALHVQPPFQRKGIGRALISNATESLIARGCKSVMLWTLKGNKTHQWYEKLNGKWLAEKSDQIDGSAFTEIAYGWEEISALS